MTLKCPGRGRSPARDRVESEDHQRRSHPADWLCRAWRRLPDVSRALYSVEPQGMIAPIVGRWMWRPAIGDSKSRFSSGSRHSQVLVRESNATLNPLRSWYLATMSRGFKSRARNHRYQRRLSSPSIYLGTLHGSDLNRRPLGHEPFSNRDGSQIATNYPALISDCYVAGFGALWLS